MKITFDLPATLLAFIQSRGRARMVASHVVLMLEAGNLGHRNLVKNVQLYALLHNKTLQCSQVLAVPCLLHS